MPEGYLARNPGQRWQTRFDGRASTTSPAEGAWSWGLQLERFGFAGAQRSIDGDACTTVDGARLEYDWGGGLREWYVNRAKGLEHGYTVLERPPSPATNCDPLTFALSVRGGLKPEVRAGGRDVDFVGEDGETVLSYAGLKVFDATGKKLSACFRRTAAGLQLDVYEAEAQYPLTIDPLAHQAQLVASNPGNLNEFGYSVGISGDTVVVGSPLEPSDSTGINGDQGAAPGYFGAGAAYVFVRSGMTWTQQAYLKASNTDSSDFFGYSVDISGDTIVIGAHGEDSSARGIDGDQDNNDISHAGAVYIFRREAGEWTQEAYVKASNTEGGSGGLYGHYFGLSVAICGNTIVVGASHERSGARGVNGDQSDTSADDSGAAYVFVRGELGWSQQAYLKASNTDVRDYFGSSVALSGDTIVVGAHYEDSAATGVDGNQDDNSSVSSGAAYIFERDQGTWGQTAYLKASNQARIFGSSVAVGQDLVVVGAPYESSGAVGVNGDQDNTDAHFSGAAYLFRKVGLSWQQEAYLKASNTDVLDEFGTTVAVGGGTVLVGAPFEDSNATGVNGDQGNSSPPSNPEQGTGAAYAYSQSGGTWIQTAYLKPSYRGGGRPALAVSGSTILYGGPRSRALDIDVYGGVVEVFESSSCAMASANQRNPGANNPNSYTVTGSHGGAPSFAARLSFHVDVEATTGHTWSTVLGYLAPDTVTLNGGQVLLMDLTHPAGDILQFGLQFGDTNIGPLVVPSDPTFCGMTLYSQAVHLGGGEPFALSNAIDLTVGK